ncbi:unnamed protein product [Somion occarium]|uniref:Zinc finger ZPR1-type domain-containing protein n=1 Tax=Somion occarium TaxID=3059160 RepID=A0ABP1E440_9APHY
MANQESKPNLFPTIGQVVHDTHLQGNDSTQPAVENPLQVVVKEEDEEDEGPVTEIESLCMNCEQQGKTRLLLTSIPFFREVVVMSFHCEHCGFSNNEIQTAGTIRHLNRQIVKSEKCTVIIPEWELTIPPSRGQLTTVEGLIRDIATDLSLDQPLRQIQNEVAYAKIQGIIDAIKEVLGDVEDEDENEAEEVKQKPRAAEIDAPMKPFTVILDDPAGNSFIEFYGSMADPKWNMRTYHRSRQQNIDLCLIDPNAEPQPEAPTIENAEELPGQGLEGENEELFVFPGTCSSCGHRCDTLIKKVNIPYFKDVLIMSTNCEACGYRDNEVKSGSAISPQGKRITLKVEDRDDLSRDILKSESAGLQIPEIDLVLQPGTLGGRFTTLEGILDQVYEELSEKVFSDAKVGDSAFENFLQRLKQVKTAEQPFTVILDDPLANSYIQSLYAPDPDPNMTIESYDRTWEQNEALGLNDMKVEGYEGDPNLPQKGSKTEQIAVVKEEVKAS